MSSKDIRWIQRFNHFNSALNQLTKFIEKGTLNELEEQGLIQAFEYTDKLAWKTLKDFVKHRGAQGIYKIMTELDDLLLPYMIDLSIFSTIGDPDVVDHIQRVGVLFYETEVTG